MPGSPASAAQILLRRRRVAAPVVVTEGFYETLVAWFQADSVCQAACPGGLVNAEAPPEPVFPYAKIWQLESHAPVSPDDAEVEAAFSVYAADDNAGAAGDEVAKDAGTLVIDRLLDPAARGAWTFTYRAETWSEAGCQWMPPGKVQVVGKSRGGNRVWRYDAWFHFFLVRN